MKHEIIHPPAWKAPRGYSNGVLAAPGRLLFVAGQIGWDEEQRLVGPDFVDQFGQALKNVVTVVETAGGHPGDVVRLTVYVVSKAEYVDRLADVGAVYREVMGRRFPSMTLVEVADLLEPGARVEIEATAVVRQGADHE